MARKTRPDWDPYALRMAETAALRADCTRSKVGAVLFDKNHRLRGSGYNGSYPGGPSCLAGECPRGRATFEQVAPGSSYDTGPGACISIHAELNLVLYTSPEEREEGTIAVTREPCDGCLRVLQGSGVSRIIWPEGLWTRRQRTWTKTVLSEPRALPIVP